MASVGVSAREGRQAMQKLYGTYGVGAGMERWRDSLVLGGVGGVGWVGWVGGQAGAAAGSPSASRRPAAHLQAGAGRGCLCNTELVRAR